MPVFTSGRLGAEGDKVFALDAGTGNTLWESSSGASHGSFVRSGDRAFLTTTEGNVRCLEGKTGKVLWEVKAGALGGRLVAYEGSIIPVGAAGGMVVALDEATGKKKWETPAFGKKSLPWVSGGRLFLSDPRYELRAIDAQTGREKWRFNEGGWIKKTEGGYVFVSNLRGKFTCLDADTGKVVWRKPRTMAYSTHWQGSHDFMLCRRSIESLFNKQLAGVDPYTWQDLWSSPENSYMMHPQIRGREVYLATQRRKEDPTILRRLDARTGASAWSHEFKDDFHRLEVVGKWLILNLRSGMACIRRDSGRIIWKVPCDAVKDSRLSSVFSRRVY